MNYYISINQEFSSEDEARNFIKKNLNKYDTMITTKKPKTTIINWRTGESRDGAIYIEGK